MNALLILNTYSATVGDKFGSFGSEIILKNWSNFLHYYNFTKIPHDVKKKRGWMCIYNLLKYDGFEVPCESIYSNLKQKKI